MPRKHRFRAAFLLSGVLAATSCGTSEGPSPEKPGSKTYQTAVTASDRAASDTLFNQVNAYRVKIGKPPFKRHPGLDHLAMAHSVFLRANRGKFKLSKSGNVSHLGFEGRAAYARINYGLDHMGENVAAGTRGIPLLDVWLSSPTHAAALKSDWTYSGMGVAVDADGMAFATQLFGSPGLPQTRLRQTFGGW